MGHGAHLSCSVLGHTPGVDRLTHRKVGGFNPDCLLKHGLSTRFCESQRRVRCTMPVEVERIRTTASALVGLLGTCPVELGTAKQKGWVNKPSMHMRTREKGWRHAWPEEKEWTQVPLQPHAVQRQPPNQQRPLFAWTAAELPCLAAHWWCC